MVLRDGEGGGGVGIEGGHSAAAAVVAGTEEARSPTNAPPASDRQREPGSSGNRSASSSLPTPLSRAVHYVLGLESSAEDTPFLATGEGSLVNSTIVEEALKLIVDAASTSFSSSSSPGSRSSKVARIDVAAALAAFASSAYAERPESGVHTLGNAFGDICTRIGGKAVGFELRSHPLGGGVDGGGANQSSSSSSSAAPALSPPAHIRPQPVLPPPLPPLDRATAVGELRLGGEGGSSAESWSNFASARSRVSVSLPSEACRAGAGAGAGADGCGLGDDDDDDDGDDDFYDDDGEGAAAALLGGLFWGAPAAEPPIQQQQHQQQHRRAFLSSPRAPPHSPPPPAARSPTDQRFSPGDECEEEGEAPQQQLKWAYEVELGTGGIQQLGWATAAAAARFTNEEGTGDARGSFAFDGRRRRAWGGGGPGGGGGVAAAAAAAAAAEADSEAAAAAAAAPRASPSPTESTGAPGTSSPAA